MNKLQYGCTMFSTVPVIHSFLRIVRLFAIASPAIALAALWVIG